MHKTEKWTYLSPYSDIMDVSTQTVLCGSLQVNPVTETEELGETTTFDW